MSIGSSRSFESETTLIFLIDGERMRVDKVKRADVSYSGDHYLEILITPITIESLKRLGAAASVEGQLGSMEFKLKPEHQTAIKIVGYFSDLK